MTMTQVGNQTPTMVDIIKEAIRQNQLELNTMLPAVIVDYDALTQTCTVQPSLKRTSIDPPSVDSRPRIEDVPVVFPRGSKGGVYFPLEKGDGVMLIFCQRSLDDWRDNGGEVQNRDTRLHDINDAVALPGLFSLSDALTNPKDGYVIVSEKIWIGNTAGSGAPLASLAESELFQAVAKTIEQLLLLPLISSMGPVNFDPTVVAALQQIQAMLETFEP